MYKRQTGKFFEVRVIPSAPAITIRKNGSGNVVRKVPIQIGFQFEYQNIQSEPTPVIRFSMIKGRINLVFIMVSKKLSVANCVKCNYRSFFVCLVER